MAMLIKVCPRCGDVMPYGKPMCSRCQAKEDERLRERKRERDRLYNKTRRDQRYGAFYNGKAWRTLAAWRLQQARWTCRTCGRLATEVDHIVPIQTEEGWKRRLDAANTQALCHECHNAKHHRFTKAKRHKAL